MRILAFTLPLLLLGHTARAENQKAAADRIANHILQNLKGDSDLSAAVADLAGLPLTEKSQRALQAVLMSKPGNSNDAIQAASSLTALNVPGTDRIILAKISMMDEKSGLNTSAHGPYFGDLALLRSKEAVGRLVQSLEKEGHIAARESAALALGEIGGKPAEGALLKFEESLANKDDRDSLVLHEQVLEALAKLKSADATKRLVEILESKEKNKRLRFAAAQNLLHLSNEKPELVAQNSLYWKIKALRDAFRATPADEASLALGNGLHEMMRKIEDKSPVQFTRSEEGDAFGGH